MAVVKITKENHIKKSEFKLGQKISHDDMGEGIIVGFSSISGNPFIFFFDNLYDDKVMCVSESKIKA